MCSELYIHSEDPNTGERIIDLVVNCVMVEYRGVWYALMRKFSRLDVSGEIYVLNAQALTFTPKGF